MKCINVYEAKVYSIILFLLTINFSVHSQLSTLTSIRPIFDPVRTEFVDLDNDGDPDVLRTFINDTIPVQVIDDDDDMLPGDNSGDWDNDCFMFDRNKDGKYGHEEDLIIDWVDTDSDGAADIQIIADNAHITDKGWTPGHFMFSIDTDRDGIFNFINWQTLQLESWEHEGRSGFYSDYSGNSMFLKTHSSTFNIKDLRLNWENPFLFYDPDSDGMSEMIIRLADTPELDKESLFPVIFSGKITDARLSFDLDNDNNPGNDFDFDLSLKFAGKGFDYSKQVHSYSNLRGLPAADTFFCDPRWRQMKELIYTDHKSAYETLLKGDWNNCWLVFDEDDDCERWERVEFYEPSDIFKIGTKNGGLDDNPQADATGDRGEWDLDFSGKGNLYIGTFDNKIHLYGAEWGAWRIDFNGKYYQGWQGWRNGNNEIPNDGFIDEPQTFASVRYEDTNGNGFFDKIMFDLNGDKIFEHILSFQDLGIDDRQEIQDISGYEFNDFRSLFEKAAEESWNNAEIVLKIAKKHKLMTEQYNLFKNPKSVHQKYQYGYWLRLFVYLDLLEEGKKNEDFLFLKELQKAFLTGTIDKKILLK